MTHRTKISLSLLLLLNSFSSLSEAEEIPAVVDTVKEITLEKIMSDPKWIGNAPQNAFWLADSTNIVFEKNSEEGSLKDTFTLNINTLQTEKVSLQNMHQVEQGGLAYNQDKTFAAYVYENDIYLLNMTDEIQSVTQLTKTSARESEPQFLSQDVLSYWAGNTLFTMDLSTKLTSELIKLQMTEPPTSPEVPDDIIAQEQHELIDYVVKQHTNKVERFEHSKNVRENDNRVSNTSVYFGNGQRLVSASLSPQGEQLFVVTSKSVPWRSDGDLMPNYIGHDGRIQFDQVRARVADAQPNQQNFWLVDITSKEVDKLTIDVLPDFDKDVLKSVKIENYREQGEKYKSKKQTRTINLIVDWSWSQSAIQWHKSGEHLAVMLEAWDNKDRWIATVDFKKKKFVSQHQLHDDAWINYTFNDFGWFNDSDILFFLSEQSGYSHLYTKALNSKKVKQVTSGKYEVSEVKLSKEDDSFYFRANVNHPGDYQIYRVDSDDKKVTSPKALTSLKGNNTFDLSPDESKLLITHSSLLSPEELYLLNIDGTNEVEMTQLTHSVNDEFKNMPWVKPEVVEVASSYTDQPIYAKVYYPADYKVGEKRRAVIFNHGAGYLQNSDFGWSGYFREFMFHNMLAQQGYVVMDMDYRASKGYGRDWRTAIYRQMGTPELQDLKDGVNWLVENANVDRERIGTYGGSYGGFMTFMAMFNEPDLFKAGAALRPVSDWAHYNDGYTSNILNRPKDDMIAYRRSSPIYFAEGLKNPLLINAPMVDNNVFFVDTVRLVQRMIELEKENFETAIYPVEAHGFIQPSSWLDEYRRIYKLFETNL